MKMQEALSVMTGKVKPAGFMVTFEHVEGNMLRSDHFPDVHCGETPIETEELAWALAATFASKTVGKCVNVYVIRREDFTPVPGYKSRLITNRGI